MNHFAYPNAIQKDDESFQFIGCGRFAVFDKDMQPDGYEEASPNTMSNKNVLKFVPKDPFFKPKKNKEIYEKTDHTKSRYFGCSLDLAWYLSYINKYRILKEEFQQFTKDIWATGEVGKSGLQPVDEEQFKEKLKAFLSDSQDNIFICPAGNFAVNMTELIKDTTIVNVYDLNKAIRNNPNKLIVLVNEDELKYLNDIFFEGKNEIGFLARIKSSPQRALGFSKEFNSSPPKIGLLILFIAFTSFFVFSQFFTPKNISNESISYEQALIKTTDGDYLPIDQCTYDSPCNITSGKSYIYVKINSEGYASAFLKDRDYYYNQEGSMFINKAVEGIVNLWPGTSDDRSPKRLFQLYIVISSQEIATSKDSKQLTQLPNGKIVGPAYVKPRPE
jgi:hypothetical protein